MSASTPPTLDAVVNLDAESVKEKGNDAFRQGDYQQALTYFTQAIEIDETNAKYLVNRSLCYSSLGEWKLSGDDARKAVQLQPKFSKAHYRLCKALIELQRFREARMCIMNALRECGEGAKEFRPLEEEIFTLTKIPMRPKPHDFEVLKELGNGNFSSVVKARHKETNELYAVKHIEKATVERMKKRHPNINNEILMEKRALYKLEHPGIAALYSTFQDYGTLYYMMEYVGGPELFTAMHEEKLTGFLSASGLNQSGENASSAQVGLHWSLARFYFAQAISAIEHMHVRGIAHRDIKPENIIISPLGHLKFVDFGTAKDFVQTDLNGPEFVGTPEYMSPSTVRSRRCGIECDLWAIGVVLFQMLFGYTPFEAPSPYLVFLRIKRAYLRLPDWTPPCVASLLHGLIQKDAQQRLRFAILGESRKVDRGTTHEGALGAEVNTGADAEVGAGAVSGEVDGKDIGAPPMEMTKVNYDALFTHPFFAHDWLTSTTTAAASAITRTTATATATTTAAAVAAAAAMASATEMNNQQDQGQGQEQLPDLSTLVGARGTYSHSALRIPTLQEICIRATGRATLLVTDKIAENGGIRPKQPLWIKNFDLQKLSPLCRSRVAHYLTRQERLHGPGVYRLFCRSAVEARACRSDVQLKSYLGLSRSLQGHWQADFVFAQLAAPVFGHAAAAAAAAADIMDTKSTNQQTSMVEYEETKLKLIISSINKIRPKFTVMIGNFTHVVAPVVDTAGACSNPEGIHGNKDETPLFNAQVDAFRKCMTRISDTIPVIYVPGPHDVGHLPTGYSLQQYRNRFGADYFGFWYGGMRGIVINSTLMITAHISQQSLAKRADAVSGEVEDAKQVDEEAQLQDLWLTEELEQCKLCATSIVVFSYHPWFIDHIDEDERAHTVGAEAGGAVSDANAGSDVHALSDITARTFPRELRHKWLQKMRHHKIRFSIASVAGKSTIDARSPAANNSLPPPPPPPSSSSSSSSSHVLPTSVRPFPKKPRRRAGKKEEDATAAAAAAIEDDEDEDSANNVSGGMPPDRSIPLGADGEALKPSEVIADAVLSGEISVEDTIAGTATTTAAAAAAALSVAPGEEGISPPEADGDNDDEESKSVTPSNSDDSSDFEDYIKDDDDDADDEKDEFLNEEDEYEGPELLTSTNTGSAVDTTTPFAAATGAGAGGTDGGFALRMVVVREFDSEQRIYTAVQEIPKSMHDALQAF